MYNEPAVALRFELLGRDTENVKSYRIQSAYMTSTDAFELTLYEPELANRIDLELQPVRVFVDQNQQILGRIERTSIGGNGLEITVSGRDYLSDMVECHVDPALKIKKQTTLGQAIIDAAKPVGISEVLSDGGQAARDLRTGIGVSGGSAGEDATQKKQDEYKPNPGEGVFQFCSRLASKHGVTIQPSDSRSKVSLTAPVYDQDPAYNIFRSTDPTLSSKNNILSATVTRDYSKFPTFTLGSGKTGKGGARKSTVGFEVKAGEGQFPTFGLIHEGRIKPEGGGPKASNSLYRLFYVRDEKARNKEQLGRSVRRAWADRTKDVLQYEVMLMGHRDISTGRTYAIDTIVQVQDEVANIDERLWVESVSFDYSEGQGATSTLKCWLPGSFQL